MAAEGVTSQFDLAVLGADDPLGESFLKALEETDVQVGRLYPLVLGEAEGIVAFHGEEWPCVSARDFDFGQTQVLVLANFNAGAVRQVGEVRSRFPAMPILSLQHVMPGPAVAVARVLRALTAVGGKGITVDALTNLPVALAGKAGLDELINQTRGLFNMESPDPEAFPLQIAFNMIPLMDEGEARYAPKAMMEAIRDQADIANVACSVTWVPVLYGATTALHVWFEHSVGLEELRLALSHQDGICLMESDLPAGNPTPATDSAESADIFIGQIKVSGNSVRMWLVYDPLRLEAEQMVATVENWIEKPANSVLT